MDILNEKINHKAYGTGTVINQDKDKISIEFCEEYGIKQFLYPDAFGEFLKLSNSDVESAVLAELQEKKSHIEELKIQKRQEEESNRLKELELLNLQKKSSKTKIPRKKKQI